MLLLRETSCSASSRYFYRLQFVPPPLLNSSKDHYKKFSDLYGEIPSDKDRPSRTPVPLEEEKQVDKGRKSLLLRGKVRGCIACSECNKPRYSHSKLTPSEVSEISQIKNSKLYTCGSVLFPPGSSHESTIVVREALVCVINIETQYYSSILVHIPPVCYYCGIGEDHLWMGSERTQEESCSCLSNLLFVPELWQTPSLQATITYG